MAAVRLPHASGGHFPLCRALDEPRNVSGKQKHLHSAAGCLRPPALRPCSFASRSFERFAIIIGKQHFCCFVFSFQSCSAPGCACARRASPVRFLWATPSDNKSNRFRLLEYGSTRQARGLALSNSATGCHGRLASFRPLALRHGLSPVLPFRARFLSRIWIILPKVRPVNTFFKYFSNYFVICM